MRFLCTLLTASLMGAAVPALAQAPASPPDASRPATTEEWHQALLAKYRQLHYLDADGKPMTAQAFIALVEVRSVGFKMTEMFVEFRKAGDKLEAAKDLNLQILKPGATS